MIKAQFANSDSLVCLLGHMPACNYEQNSIHLKRLPECSPWPGEGKGLSACVPIPEPGMQYTAHWKSKQHASAPNIQMLLSKSSCLPLPAPNIQMLASFRAPIQAGQAVAP